MKTADWELLWREALAARSVRLSVAFLVCWRPWLGHVLGVDRHVDIAELGSESFGSEAQQGHQDEAGHAGALTGFEEQTDLLWTMQQVDLDGGARIVDRHDIWQFGELAGFDIG